MLAAISLLSAANLQAFMAQSVDELAQGSNSELLDIAVERGLTPPEVRVEQDPDDLDDDQRLSLILEIAYDKTDQFVDNLVNLPEPWETLSDVVRVRLMREAIEAFDTPEERQALWNKLRQVWADLKESVAEGRARRQSRRAKRSA
jgi:uncharacterized protein YjiS (DUF1127 family)